MANAWEVPANYSQSPDAMEAPEAIDQRTQQHVAMDAINAVSAPNPPMPTQKKDTNKGTKVGLRSVLAGMLKDLSYGAGQAMMKEAGLPTDADIAQQNVDNAYKIALTKQAQQTTTNMAERIPIDIGNGQIMYVPIKVAEGLIKTREGNKGKMDVAQFNANAAMNRQNDQQEFVGGENQKDRDLKKLLAEEAEKGKNFRSQFAASRGTWVALTDNNGRITKFYNNKNPQMTMEPTEEGLRKSGLSGEELGTRAGFKNVLNVFDDLEKAIDKRPDTVGPLAGITGPLEAEYIGKDPAAADIYQKISDVQNRLVYLFSGKQINEEEYKRLLKALPKERLPYQTIKVRMKNFRGELKKVYQDRTGESLEDAAPTPTQPQSKPKATHRWNPATGKVEAIGGN